MQAGCHGAGHRHSRAHPQPPRHIDDQPYTDPALHYALCLPGSVSYTYTHTQSGLNVLFTPESLSSPDTKPCLHISPTHTRTLSTHRHAASFLTLIPPYKLNSLQLLSLHLLDFLFSTPLCSPPPLVPSSSTSSLCSVGAEWPYVGQYCEDCDCESLFSARHAPVPSWVLSCRHMV